MKLGNLSALALAIGVVGTAQAATVNVVPGWNLLGYSDSVDVTVANAFGNASKVTTVWKWNATTARWAFYSPALQDGGQAYAVSKNYDFLTTLKPGDGFWVNAKEPFSATLPATAPTVSNPEALAGITATLTTFQEQFATAIPVTTDVLSTLIDDTMLLGSTKKAEFLQAMLIGGEGPSVGTTFVNIVLVNPTDVGAAPNDATHQWFTFDDSTGEGPESAWLAIKNASGNWLLAGDQRMFDYSTESQASKHVAVSGAITYSSQINVWLEYLPTDVASVVLTGPGVVPSGGITIYSATQGQIFVQACGIFGNTTNCIDANAASAGSQFTIKTYSATSGTPLHTYTNTLYRAPLSVSSLASASFPTITGVTGSWAPGTSVTVNWTMPPNTQGNWIDLNAWSNQSGQLFNNVGFNLSGSNATSATLTLPNYSGTITNKGVWLSIYDASGNRLALDQQY